MLDLSKFPKIICQRFKCKITYSYIVKNTKEKYLNMAELLCFRSGFGWDSTTKWFTALKEVWTEYLKAHPNFKKFSDETFEEYDDLKVILQEYSDGCYWIR
ncbi:unnamed protein product [Brassica rapa subsp. trilocularis]